ncbi:ABC transporter permease [Diaminobutyricimonas sp. LJ205]|uniref:ABC transporter permease n=1 Tax=Diaminobutyricimonas sp. LJ205 TaxID=2683590 RepID=UPI0012F491B3|nr:ABC transporter permease [Diaminobutyricimonas sp. LJ205]
MSTTRSQVRPLPSPSGLALRWFRRRLTDPVNYLTIGVALGFFVLWEIAVKSGAISRLILPAPSAIFDALLLNLGMPVFWEHTWITLQEILVGFAAGSIAGFVLGAGIGVSRVAQRVFGMGILVLQAIPKVAVAPIIAVWLGYGLTAKAVITALLCFFPVFANTVAGIRSTPTEYQELVSAYRGSRTQRFFHVTLPNALPSVFVGLNVGLTLAVIGAIVAEFVGSSKGLGAYILAQGFQLNVAGVFCALLVLAVITIILSEAVSFLSRRVVFWAPESVAGSTI